jgi:hypothetical protein
VSDAPDILRQRLDAHKETLIERIQEATSPVKNPKLTKEQLRKKAIRLAKGSAFKRDEIEAIVERHSMQGAHLAEKGYELAITSADGKEFSNAVRGMQGGIAVFRQALGLDKKDDTAKSVSLSIFVARDSDVKPVRNVTPVAEVIEDSDDDEPKEISA